MESAILNGYIMEAYVRPIVHAHKGSAKSKMYLLPGILT